MKYMLLIYLEENALTESEREHCYVESAQLAQDLHSTGQYLATAPPSGRSMTRRWRAGQRDLRIDRVLSMSMAPTTSNSYSTPLRCSARVPLATGSRLPRSLVSRTHSVWDRMVTTTCPGCSFSGRGK